MKVLDKLAGKLKAEALALWSEMWLMPFNQDKCKVLHIAHYNHYSHCSMGNWQIGYRGGKEFGRSRGHEA